MEREIEFLEFIKVYILLHLARIMKSLFENIMIWLDTGRFYRQAPFYQNYYKFQLNDKSIPLLHPPTWL